MTRLAVLALAASASGCGFFDQQPTLCTEWCSFIRCLASEICDDEQLVIDACPDTCETTVKGMRDRDVKLARECLTCIDEATQESCDVEDDTCLDSCEDNGSVENAVETFVEAFFGELQQRIECQG